MIPVAVIVTNVPDELSPPERACLELAWQALLAGTIPVGAVVTDAAGAIVGSGRNAVYGTAEPPLIGGTLLAHAEVNALIGLPSDGQYRDFRLVTSLEPCQLCTGAVLMAGTGLSYLGADPVNGTAWALESARYAGHHRIAVNGPRADQAGRLAAALAAAYHLRSRPQGRYVTAYRERRPDMVATATALIEAGMFEMADQRLGWAEAGPRLLAAV
jgi:tRNA(Arg) A34 adenosine deaminase TadA